MQEQEPSHIIYFYVENDSANYGPLPDQYQVDQLLSRCSKDQVTIENGKELVDLCISANLHLSLDSCIMMHN